MKMRESDIKKQELQIRSLLTRLFNIGNRLDQEKLVSDFCKSLSDYKLPAKLIKKNDPVQIFRFKLLCIVKYWDSFLAYCEKTTGISLPKSNQPIKEKSLVDSLISI